MIDPKSKKFVFSIYPENVSFIESLSYEQKNDIINRVLQEYLIESTEAKKSRDLVKFTKKVIFFVLLVLVGIPLFIMTINFCFDATVNSYSKMEKNFERLFNEQQR